MAKYRKKPVEIEAIQWTENNLKEILAWIEMTISCGLVVFFCNYIFK